MNRSRGQAARWAAGAAVVLVAGGCARLASTRPFDEEAHGLRRAEESTDRPVVSVSGPPRITPVPVRVVEATPLTAGSEPGATAVAPGEEAGGQPAQTRDTTALIEAKVGDINGRPLFAGEFFSNPSGPGARLAELARNPDVTPADWEALAARAISNEMQRLLNNELLEAEARASLKPENRLGLKAWLEDTAVEGRRRQAGGSRAEAERQMLEERDQTLEEFARERESEELVRMQVRKILENQLNVSSRDLKLEYERSFKEFNPTPRARLRMIRVSTDAAEDVLAVGAALDAGEPFEQVASRPANTSNREESGAQEKLFTGELKDASLFGTVEPLNEAARRLAPGEWTRTPVVYDSWTAWLKLESVEVIRRPLTDESVQLELWQRIRIRKIDQLIERYVGRLSQRASVTDINEMKALLHGVARERYWRRP